MWTDERLDERFNAVDKRFDDLERRMEAGFDRVDRDIRDLRMLMFQLWGPTMLGILGTIATVLITNT
jgi:hypothetical protein